MAYQSMSATVQQATTQGAHAYMQHNRGTMCDTHMSNRSGSNVNGTMTGGNAPGNGEDRHRSHVDTNNSGSTAGSKPTRRRSHRPRGCRGGSSRRRKNSAEKAKQLLAKQKGASASAASSLSTATGGKQSHYAAGKRTMSKAERQPYSSAYQRSSQEEREAPPSNFEGMSGVHPMSAAGVEYPRKVSNGEDSVSSSSYSNSSTEPFDCLPNIPVGNYNYNNMVHGSHSILQPLGQAGYDFPDVPRSYSDSSDFAADGAILPSLPPSETFSMQTNPGAGKMNTMFSFDGSSHLRSSNNDNGTAAPVAGSSNSTNGGGFGEDTILPPLPADAFATESIPTGPNPYALKLATSRSRHAQPATGGGLTWLGSTRKSSSSLSSASASAPSYVMPPPLASGPSNPSSSFQRPSKQQPAAFPVAANPFHPGTYPTQQYRNDSSVTSLMTSLTSANTNSAYSRSGNTNTSTAISTNGNSSNNNSQNNIIHTNTNTNTIINSNSNNGSNSSYHQHLAHPGAFRQPQPQMQSSAQLQSSYASRGSLRNHQPTSNPYEFVPPRTASLVSDTTTVATTSGNTGSSNSASNIGPIIDGLSSIKIRPSIMPLDIGPLSSNNATPDYYHEERLQKQRQQSSGSLFVTSPRSFLHGFSKK